MASALRSIFLWLKQFRRKGGEMSNDSTLSSSTQGTQNTDTLASKRKAEYIAIQAEIERLNSEVEVLYPRANWKSDKPNKERIECLRILREIDALEVLLLS